MSRENVEAKAYISVENIHQTANLREVKCGIGTGSKFKSTLSQQKRRSAAGSLSSYHLSQSSPALVKSSDKRYYFQSTDLQTGDLVSNTLNKKDPLPPKKWILGDKTPSCA